MNVSCSFCSIAKADKYLFTECNHFVCLNCAALRVDEDIKCCNVATKLSPQVMDELKRRKSIIMLNLQNEYQYNRVDLNKLQLNQIDANLKLPHKHCQYKQIAQGSSSLNKSLQKRSNQIDIEAFYQTPMNQFYKNSFVLQNDLYQIPSSTPIKVITNMEADLSRQHYPQKQVQTRNKKLTNGNVNICSLNSNQSNNVLQSRKFERGEFGKVLQLKIDEIRQEFKTFYHQLQKKEATMVYQLKIYFEEYMKLVQSQNQQTPSQQHNWILEKERVGVFLNDFISKSELNVVRHIIRSEQVKNNQNQLRILNNLPHLEPKNQGLRQQSNTNYLKDSQQVLSSIDNHNNQRKMPITGKNQKFNDSKQLINKNLENTNFDKIQKQENENSRMDQNPQTNRNLNKVYKKLEQSRTKLEQRIQKHNAFISDRFNRLCNV